MYEADRHLPPLSHEMSMAADALVAPVIHHAEESPTPRAPSPLPSAPALAVTSSIHLPSSSSRRTGSPKENRKEGRFHLPSQSAKRRQKAALQALQATQAAESMVSLQSLPSLATDATSTFSQRQFRQLVHRTVQASGSSCDISNVPRDSAAPFLEPLLDRSLHKTTREKPQETASVTSTTLSRYDVDEAKELWSLVSAMQ